jgi:hypothetical protein
MLGYKESDFKHGTKLEQTFAKEGICGFAFCGSGYPQPESIKWKIAEITNSQNLNKFYYSGKKKRKKRNPSYSRMRLVEFKSLFCAKLWNFTQITKLPHMTKIPLSHFQNRVDHGTYFIGKL